MTNIDSKILEQAELILGSGSPAWSVITDGIYKSGEIYALAVSGTDIYVGGNFTKLGNANARHIAKWNGTSWSTLGGGCAQATETVYTIAISGTDIYVGGNFTSLLDAANNPVAYTSYIAKWNGSAWTTLARGTNGDVRAIAISGSKVYVGGIFSNSDGVSIRARPSFIKSVIHWPLQIDASIIKASKLVCSPLYNKEEYPCIVFLAKSPISNAFG